jgi:hypothetical protein
MVDPLLVEDVMEALTALGPISLTVLALGLAGLLCLVGCGLGSLRGRRVPAPLWLLPAVAVATPGLFGAWFALGVVIEASSQARSTLVMAMVAAGSAFALEPALLGTGLAGVLALLAAWTLAVLPLLRREPSTRWSPGHALIPAVLVVLGAPLLARVAGPVGALVALVGAFPCVLVALRCGVSGATPQGPGLHLARGRFTVAALAPAGALALAQASRIQRAREIFEAIGFASAHTKASMLAAMGTPLHTPAVVLAALLVLVVGAAVVAPVVRERWDSRAWLGAAAMVLLALPPLFGRSLLVDRLAEAREEARPWYELRVEQLAALGIELPRSSALRLPMDMLTVSVAPDGLAVEGLPLPWDAPHQDGLHWPLFRALDSHAVAQAELAYEAVPFRGSLLLEAHGALSWSQLEPLLRTASGARFVRADIAVANVQRRLSVIQLELVGAVHPEAGSTPPAQIGSAEGEPERFLFMPRPRRAPPMSPVLLEALDGVWRISARGMEPGLARDTDQLRAAARVIKGQYPDVDEFGLVLAPDTTWAELVAALDAVRGDGTGMEELFLYPYVVLEPPAEEPGVSPEP